MLRKRSPICDCSIIHHDSVQRALRQKPHDVQLEKLSELFKIIGDQTRLRILWALDQNEMCVCDIANVLGMTKSAVSHQLAILRSAGIVKYRRSGKEVYYMLDDHHITQLYEIGLLHIIHQIKSTREAEDEVSIQDQ